MAKKLSDFIRGDLAPILDAWEQFVRTIPSARRLDAKASRNHAGGILQAIATDLDHAQTNHERLEKSQGRGPASTDASQAALHGAERAAEGFSINEGLSEFRALRASVLQLWRQSSPDAPPVVNEELVRFNEAIDQAVAESVARYASDKEQTNSLFDTLLSASPDLNFLLDAQGRFIYANQAMADFYAMAPSDLAGSRIADLGGPVAADVQAHLQEVFDRNAVCRGEVPHLGESRRELTHEYVLVPVIGPPGRVEAIAGVVRDITEHKAYAENIERTANFDELTGLPNRRVFRDRIEQDLNRSQRAGRGMALMIMDLDGFKDVNDRLGHDAGDKLLQQVAQRLIGCVRRTDTVARIGGDEFSIIIPELDRASQIELVAQKMLDQLGAPFLVQDEAVQVSGSIGITLFPLDASAPEDLMRNADQAMYAAKKGGRNRFSFYTIGMRDAACARSKLRDELRVAVREHQLCMHYQPIVDLAVGDTRKAEALLRWQHPEAGLTLPAHFLGLAEESGLIAQIDAWVLEEAAGRAAEWSRLLGTEFRISVNNSAVEFLGHEPMKCWDAYLANRGRGSDGISVEVPEAVVSSASPAVVERLKALRQAGVQLTLDGFGTGCSSMASLKQLEVDCLKIDQSFVRAPGKDGRTIVQAAITMGHTLGLKVIAEGVETAEQRDWLKGAGCDYAQGYFFSHPLPAPEFLGLLEAGRTSHPPARPGA